MEAAELKRLKHLIDKCGSDPSALADSRLVFFRDYLESLGAKLPFSAYDYRRSKLKAYVVAESNNDKAENKGLVEVRVEEEEKDDERIVSNIEFKGETVTPDDDPPQEYFQKGDPSVEDTEGNRVASRSAKTLAMEALSKGDMNKAIELLKVAISLNPKSATMYATRASVYIQMQKPNAAIRDANAALEINPDSAMVFKYRGMARAMLGQWEEAAKDLHLAAKLDHSET